MPGIAGFIATGATGQRALALVRRMTRQMLHETFYTHGVEQFAAVNTALGWVALPGSFSDCMPVWNEAHNVCLIFSGEHHADASVADHLRRSGHDVTSIDDARYLIHLYEEHGSTFAARLNGMFSGAIVDLRKCEILVFNDRFGMGRVYYHENADGLYFASEAKSLLAVLPHTRAFDHVALGEYLRCGCALENRTLFAGISLLPSGSQWFGRLGSPIRKTTYVDVSGLENAHAMDGAEYEAQLEQVWRRILPRYCRGPEPVALALTGGVDSRMILACLPPDAASLPCYTFAGPYRDCEDVRLSERLAKMSGHPHHRIDFGDAFIDHFPELAEEAVYMTDGAAEVKGACDLYGQRQARRLAPVRLSGVYGGEILRRLIVFKPTLREPLAFSVDLKRAMSDAESTYKAVIAGHSLSFCAFKQSAWHLYGPLAVDRTQVTLRSPYLDNEVLELSYRAPHDLAREVAVSLRLIEKGEPRFSRLPTDRGLSYPPIRMLTAANHAWKEFTFRAEYAYDYGMPQPLARVDGRMQWLHLERLFLGRHKFYHFRVWYRDRMQGMLRERLLDRATLALTCFNAAGIRRVVEGHLSGRANHTIELHKLLSLEIIHRRLLSGYFPPKATYDPPVRIISHEPDAIGTGTAPPSRSGVA